MADRLVVRQLDRWHAESTDGTWAFERLEDRGSTWAAYHLPDHLYAGQWPSLRKIRKAGRPGLTAALIEEVSASQARKRNTDALLDDPEGPRT